MYIFKGIIAIKYFFMDFFSYFLEHFSTVLEHLNPGPSYDMP